VGVVLVMHVLSLISLSLSPLPFLPPSPSLPFPHTHKHTIIINVKNIIKNLLMFVILMIIITILKQIVYKYTQITCIKSGTKGYSSEHVPAGIIVDIYIF
jgi:magnesium-transporting ATPase (P-type)